MHKKLGAILLIAGTCIGSGMIALPMVLAKLGLIPSALLMLIVWFVMYHTSLINLELNLQANDSLPLGELGKIFSGKTAKLIGTLFLKLLSYSLLAVFIYGASSVLQKLLITKWGLQYSLETLASYCVFATFFVLLFPLRFIDYINRFLFTTLLSIVFILIIGLTISVKWSDLPLFAERYNDPSAWMALLPIVFTSFGFQVIFHTVTNYCNKNAKLLKQAFFWGSFIPALVYILWTCSILSVVYHDNPSFYLQMVKGNAEIGDLIHVLSKVAKWPSMQFMIWWISLLAIITSVIGVGVGLFDLLQRNLSKKISHGKLHKIAAAFLTVFPAYLAVIYVPNAFLTVLGFAGMILAVIAILLPSYLFVKMNVSTFYFEELETNWLTKGSVVVAMTVIGCEMYNMLGVIK